MTCLIHVCQGTPRLCELGRERRSCILGAFVTLHEVVDLQFLCSCCLSGAVEHSVQVPRSKTVDFIRCGDHLKLVERGEYEGDGQDEFLSQRALHSFI